MNPYQKLIDALAHQQNNNGSFTQSTTPLTSSTDSIYYTALILVVLSKIPNSPTKELIVQKGISFLKNEISVLYTWNYITRNKHSTYPDDLDDTFLCITAIAFHDKDFITPEFFVSITRLLIAQEVAPGGPYKTWITHETNWKDVDIVVNANIYRFLVSEGIQLPELEQFFMEKIKHADFTSQYYHKPLVVIYFLSECLPALLKQKLIHVVMDHPELIKPRSEFEHCLYTLIIHNTREYWTPTTISSATFNYTTTDNSLFIEQKTKASTVYSTCEAFALVIKLQTSLLTINTSQPETNTSPGESYPVLEKVFTVIEKNLHDFPLLKQKILDLVYELVTTHPKQELFLPYVFYKNLEKNYQEIITEETLYNLCASTLLGWVGFTIQDKIVDHESPTLELPLATTSILICQDLVLSTTDNLQNRKIIQDLLHTINESLLFEITYQTQPIKDSRVDLSHVSNQSEPLTRSANKSLGIALGPSAIVFILPITNKQSLVERLTNYFRYLLTIKQTLDDMHDWYSDLKRGCLNPVAVRILIVFKKHHNTTLLDIQHHKNKLYNLFWNYIFDDLYQELTKTITDARSIIHEFTFLNNTQFLHDPLDRYCKLLENTRAEKDRGTQFLNHYIKTTSQ